MGSKTDAEQALEALLDVGVKQAERLIDRIEIDLTRREFSAQEDPVFDADRKTGANEPIVPTEHVLVQIDVILLGRGHHVRLVLQSALAKREPHRGEVLLLALHAHEPPHTGFGAGFGDALDSNDVVMVSIELAQPFVNLALQHGQFAGVHRLCHVGSSPAW